MPNPSGGRARPRPSRWSRAGQIVIPAMLIFPTLFLFVYLIYETAKLSSEKIRHQFAVDAAAFVEMTNYSDFLNRTAYVNGAFPMRIFGEGYDDFTTECNGKTDTCDMDKKPYSDIMYANGAFPRSISLYGSGAQPGMLNNYAPGGSWDIEYGGTGAGKNSAPPSMPGQSASDPYMLFTLDNANKFWHQWDLATEIYKLWVQIYSLLGSVEDAQFKVLQRLSGDHGFMKKSYWLNTGDPINDAATLAHNFDVALGAGSSLTSVVTPYCTVYLDYWGNRHLGGGGIQPFTPAHATDPIKLQTSAPCTDGVFGVEYVDQNFVKSLRDKHGDYPGLLIWMNWSIPKKNYWNIDFPTLMNHAAPQGTLRTTISLQGDPANKPSVWPDPTPKFQVRQFP